MLSCKLSKNRIFLTPDTLLGQVTRGGCTLRCFEHSLQQKSSCCFLMCCSSSSNLEKTFGSEQRGHSGDSRCLFKTGKKNIYLELQTKAHLFIVHVFHSHASLLTQVKLVPVLGVNFFIAEIDVVLLLTMKSMIGQTRECLYFFHKYHLKRTRQACYTSGSSQSRGSLRKAITCSRN